MSDVCRGPGWWLASDGKWYEPSLAPSSFSTGYDEETAALMAQYSALASQPTRLNTSTVGTRPAPHGGAEGNAHL